ncbi:hypothetical protein D9756_001349 [Leucocoprinus leucothites]|uniref:F-box domain-containing protein n=1 Tax=Leucocoprinus leucothites TaxID=201217 RepID=A0A8H5G524_9AGAR|nr:hypothetical protein D9756_001349 [Leucoagaricus leucothites]
MSSGTRRSTRIVNESSPPAVAQTEGASKKKKLKRMKTTGTTAAQLETWSETESATQAQNAASTNRRAKARRGCFQLITEFPLDILHETFRGLDILDLLNLSWASKDLRRVIMEKSAKYIWEESARRFKNFMRRRSRLLAALTTFILPSMLDFDSSRIAWSAGRESLDGLRGLCARVLRNLHHF